MSAKSRLLCTAAPIADLAALQGDWLVVAEARDRVPLPWLCLFDTTELVACTASWLEAATIDGQTRQLLRKKALRNAAVPVPDAKRHLLAARPVFERSARDPQVGARRWKEAVEALDRVASGWFVIDPGAVLQRPALGDGAALFAAALSSGPASQDAKRRLARVDPDASDDENFDGMDAGVAESGRFARRTRPAADAAKHRALLDRLDHCQLAQTPTGFEPLPLSLDSVDPPESFWTDDAALEHGRRHATISFGSLTFLGAQRHGAVELHNASSRPLRVVKFANFDDRPGGPVITGKTGTWSTAKDFARQYGVPADGWIAPGGSATDPVHLCDDTEGFCAYWCENDAGERFIALGRRAASRTGGLLRVVDGRAVTASRDPYLPCPPSIRRLVERHAGICRQYAQQQFKRAVQCDLDGVRWLDDAIEQNHALGARGRTAGNVALFGAFLGECLVKVHGGQWQRHEEILCVRLGDATWFPFFKVEKQLAEGRGAGESVLGFFQGIAAIRRHSEPHRHERLVTLFKARRDYQFLVSHGKAGEREWSKVRRIDGAWVTIESLLTAGLSHPPDVALSLSSVAEFKVLDASGRPVDPDFAVVKPTQVLALPAQPEMERALTQQRLSFASRRSALTRDALTALAAARPAWMRDVDGLIEAVNQQRRLLGEGTVVWGALVQANMKLFAPGDTDSAAQMIYSPDPYFDARPAELRAIAQRLMALKGTTPADPQERAVAAQVTNEMNRTMGWPLPSDITPRAVFSAAIVVYRSHLPTGVLRGMTFPILTHPATPAVMILPGAFWTPEFVAARV